MASLSRSHDRLPRAAVIVHPGKVNLEALRTSVETAEARHHFHPSTWYSTSPGKLGDDLAREAIAADHDLVIAAGGDGTVRAVAEALENTGVPLGIVPAGTGNLLARNLNVDVLSMNVAVDTAFSGNLEAIDVGHARVERPDGTREHFLFTVLGGIGVDAGMIANTPSELKRRVGWFAYLKGIHRTIVSGVHFNARVRVDHGPARSLRAQSIMVGNCGLMPGGMLLLPDAEIDDGRLDLCILRPRGILGWLQITFRMLWQTILARGTTAGRKVFGATREIRALRYEQAEVVTFRISSGPEEFEVDGEAVGEIVAARMSVNPSALTVVVPGGFSTNQQRLLLEEALAVGERQHRRIRERLRTYRERFRRGRARAGERPAREPAAARQPSSDDSA